ncbi:hypothetical protein GCM10022409_44760 [Hymenobacter glaciei]|uniref:Oxygen sensor histidine kinase NreB n=1 Tax=Hymenobacter glaciei TaxID=877209 RepID=A0ABP7UUH3_9BACT
MLGAWLAGGQPRAAAGQAAPSDSLARRRAVAPDSAQARLLLRDAAALLAPAPVQARQLAEQAVRAARTSRQPAHEQAAHLLLGRLANGQGDFAAAARHLVLALQMATQRHDTLGQGIAYLNLSNTNKRLKQLPKALADARRAQALLAPLARAGNAKAATAYVKALSNSGTVQMEMQHYGPARTDLLASLRQSRALGDSAAASLALYNLGAVALTTKQGADAYRYYRQTLALDQASGNPQAQGESWLNLGDALALLHRPAEAEAAYRRALPLAREAGALPLVRVAYNGFATLYEETGRPALALAWQKRFIALNDSLYEQSRADQAAELQTKYETEEQAARNRLQAAQLRTQQQIIRRRNVQLGAGLAIAALLAGLAYLLLNRHRLRREVEFAQERQQLAQLRAQAVLEAEETERRRIGADLHDGVGQLLTAAKLNLHALGDELGVPTAGQQALLQNALDVVDESFREVRSISHNLIPNALIKRGLALAVRDFLDKIPAVGRVKINLEVVGIDQGERLLPATENVLFRVIQELIQNILKHAHATEVTLQLIRHATELTVLVEDNGVGFDPAALGEEAGIGLKNIGSRMAYLGGWAEFDSAPGRGTTVTLEVPLAAAG